jgi:Leucine Rich repeat
MEQILAIVLITAIVLLGLGYLALVVNGFRVSRRWGLINLLLPPIGVLFFPFRHLRKAILPYFFFLLAGVAFAAPYGVSYYEARYGKRTERMRIVDGKRHLTLTDWQDGDYNIIRRYPDVAVLQMANNDVTDDTLQLLEGCDKLETLDLNDTAITDKGLAVLAKLPALKELRLARTPITEEGVATYIFPLQTLEHLDLTGVKGIPGKKKREWVAAKPDRKLLN